MIEGSKITDVRTLKSWYDQDSIELMTKDKIYRLKVRILLKIMKQLVFNVECSPATDKRYKHTYLNIQSNEEK